MSLLQGIIGTVAVGAGIAAGGAEPVAGIGVSLRIESETAQPRIVRVMPESPAARAELVAGWNIVRIDDTPTAGKTMEQCVALIRGPIGSKISVEVANRSLNRTNRVEMLRDVVKVTYATTGTAAAPLSIAKWIKGQPVDVRDRKQIYVVEFWATWCGPCRVSIPHLSALQKEYAGKGVTVIGISDEAPATVTPFVDKMKESMNYTVACDNEHDTYGAYMEAFGANAIPRAFVVDRKGTIAWTGHPMAGLDEVLKQLTAETPAGSASR